MRYRVSTEQVGDRYVCRLHDDENGSMAAVLPSYGFNLFDLRLPLGGAPRRVVVAKDDFAARPSNPGGNGIPVLFPFPNRIAGARFSFGGKEYALPANNGPNAIHGFAIAAPWDVEEHQANDEGAWVTGRFQLSKNAPEHLDQWPSDAVLTLRYSLAKGRLGMDITVTNPTAGELPYGFGIHPYFALPFDPKGDRARTKLVIPASQSWALKDYIPTGDRVPVGPRLDFREGQSMEDLKLDDVLTGLAFDGDHATCRMIDEALGAELKLVMDRHFREVVVYTPPGPGGVIAVEPYTMTTDAIHLEARGVDAGLRVLTHGQHEAMALALEAVG